MKKNQPQKEDRQNISTPWKLIHAIEEYFQIKFKYDMAADEENKKARFYFGEKDDSTVIDWPRDGQCWLNPSFSKQTKYVPKCAMEAVKGSKIKSIWPLSGDANQNLAWKYADVYVIVGRIWPNVRSCMLCDWERKNHGIVKGLKWDKQTLTQIW